MSQDELASRIRRKHPRLKLSGVRISRYERNLQTPRLEVLSALADETGKPLEFFVVSSNSDGEGEDDEEADSTVAFRAAYELDLQGNHALADQLRIVARRRSRFPAASRAHREAVKA